MLMSRGKSNCQCPVSGCNGVWKKDSTIVDNAFRIKLDRFQRSQRQTQSSTSQRDEMLL